MCRILGNKLNNFTGKLTVTYAEVSWGASCCATPILWLLWMIKKLFLLFLSYSLISTTYVRAQFPTLSSKKNPKIFKKCRFKLVKSRAAYNKASLTVGIKKKRWPLSIFWGILLGCTTSCCQLKLTTKCPRARIAKPRKQDEPWRLQCKPDGTWASISVDSRGR